MISSRANILLLAACAAVLAACDDGQTYGFDDSGSYTGESVLSMGAASGDGDAGSNAGSNDGSNDGSVTPLPAATLSFDGDSALTLWPGCTFSVTKTGIESTQDQRDTNVQKANGSDFQVTDTYEQAYDFAVAPNQSCAVGPTGDSHVYTMASGTVRFTVAGHASGNVGGVSSGATFVYTFDGDRS